MIRKQNYLKELKQQVKKNFLYLKMDQKNTISKKEQYISKLEERRELEAMNMYNPFGKGGAGAPLRDANGNLINKRINTYESAKIFNANQINYNYNNNNLQQQQFNNLNNPNYPISNQNNMNRNYGLDMNQMNYQNPNLNNYYNEISNINMKNMHNNQYLNNLMSNINIGAQEYPNTSKNRTQSANLILDHNKNIYNQNILNDINRVYEESSKVQNYNLHSDLNIPPRNQTANYNMQNDFRRAANTNNTVDNSPPSI